MSPQKFETDYIDVAARLVEFRGKFPDGSLQPADLTVPYRIEQIGEQTYIVVVAAAYRTAGDERPGIGMAYEVFPGKTNFTRGSELQNAETSAWGRAIVAALAADTKKGIASAEEVRNRQAERDDPLPAPPVNPLQQAKSDLWVKAQARGWDAAQLADEFATWSQGDLLAKANAGQIMEFAGSLTTTVGRKKP